MVKRFFTVLTILGIISSCGDNGGGEPKLDGVQMLI